jgi:hypothetical protein
MWARKLDFPSLVPSLLEFLKWSYLVSWKQGFSSRVRLLCLWNCEIGMSQKKQQCMVLMGQSYELGTVVLHIKDTFGQAQKQTPQESHSSLRNIWLCTSSSSSEGLPRSWDCALHTGTREKSHIPHGTIQCTLYSVQGKHVHCTVYSKQCTVCSAQCTVYSLQCTVYSVQCTVYSVQCTVYSV